MAFPLYSLGTGSGAIGMSTAPSISSELRELYSEQSTRIQQEFEATGDGKTAVAQRTALVEDIALRLWKEFIALGDHEPENFALVAIGGFGRRWLFPHSDIDVLFLHADEATEAKYKDRIRQFSQELWDLRMKLSPATRNLAECDHFDSNNVEFTISLLDCRYLAGERELFAKLHDKIIPKLIDAGKPGE